MSSVAEGPRWTKTPQGKEMHLEALLEVSPSDTHESRPSLVSLKRSQNLETHGKCLSLGFWATDREDVIPEADETRGKL